MEHIKISTDRLAIKEFDLSMAEDVHLNSLDNNNRKFVPDEVFETIEDARKILLYLIDCYSKENEPLVYQVIYKNNKNIGHVQAVPLVDGEWEVGYHIATDYTGNGYATEALIAFLPVIMNELNITHIWGICRADNFASRKVLEKCTFKLCYKSFENYHGKQHEICKYLYCI